jgi:DNA-binding LacI/PurR family transcriptional regulator
MATRPGAPGAERAARSNLTLSFVPKHRRVAEHIKARIRDGAYRVGEILPGQRVLAEELSVSRPSVKRAIETLEEEGILSCNPSVGSVVKRLVSERLLVGYLVPDLQDPFHLELIRELDSLLHRHHGSLLVQQGRDITRLAGAGLTHLVKHHELYDHELANRIPTVYTGQVPGRAVSIVSDVGSGMRQIYAHLAELGHRRFAYASPFRAEQDPQFMALAAAMATDGRSVPAEWHLRVDPLDRPLCDGIVAKISGDPEPPTALICYNDWLAIGLISAARERGLEIPQRLSLTGYDDLYVSSLLGVPLTTVRFSRKETARIIMDILLQGHLQEAVTEVVETRLIVRESTGRARA